MQSDRSRRYRAERRWVIMGGAIAALAAAPSPDKPPGDPSLDKPAGKPLHGAMPFQQQDSLLAPWLASTASVGVPQGVSPDYWRALVPDGNPGNAAQVALGRKLYFESRLSKDRSVACATCHDVSRGFNDHRGRAEGIGDQ